LEGLRINVSGRPALCQRKKLAIEKKGPAYMGLKKGLKRGFKKGFKNGFKRGSKHGVKERFQTWVPEKV
jgi:flagellar biosynthesis/type III secretory pathway protein FliH